MLLECSLRCWSVAFLGGHLFFAVLPRQSNSIWQFPLFFPLAIFAFGYPKCYFSLAIIAFGAFESIVPKYYYRLGVVKSQEVLHGVGADGVGVEFPIFAVNCCCLPLSLGEKGEKCVEKGEKCVKRGRMRKKGGITPTPSAPTPLRTSQKEESRLLNLKEVTIFKLCLCYSQDQISLYRRIAALGEKITDLISDAMLLWEVLRHTESPKNL